MQIDSAQFQELVEHSAHLILCADPAGHILYVNSACRQALGFECGLPQNLSFVDLIHSDYRIEYKKLFRNLLEGQSVPRFETAMLASNGQTVSVEGSFTCRFENEAPCLIQGVFLDITERKRAEDVLARQATAFLRVHNTLEARDRELANTLEQARKLREAQDRAHELAQINEELTEEVERRRQAEEKIRASLKEKEVLLKEIHHRVKNNLQIISSLLNLQAGYVKDPHTLEMFKESQGRIQSMALIHEKLYQSEDLARVNFAEYLESLVRFLVRSYSAGGISIRMDIAPVFLSLDTSIPCGLIVSELISNSLKYAFPRGQAGEVYVVLKQRDALHYVLTVGDTGAGFPEGLDFRATDSLGLQLVTTLVQQLDGDIELDCSRGTAFTIRFTVHKSDRPAVQPPG